MEDLFGFRDDTEKPRTATFEPGISSRRRFKRTEIENEDEPQDPRNQGNEYATTYQLEEEKAVNEVSCLRFIPV